MGNLFSRGNNYYKVREDIGEIDNLLNGYDNRLGICETDVITCKSKLYEMTKKLKADSEKPSLISNKDFESIQAMFYKDTTSSYKILEIKPEASDTEVKKAYRKMAAKFHPDKVHHLGEEFQKMAEEKFKTLNDAYTQIKKERGLK